MTDHHHLMYLGRLLIEAAEVFADARHEPDIVMSLARDMALMGKHIRGVGRAALPGSDWRTSWHVHGGVTVRRIYGRPYG